MTSTPSGPPPPPSGTVAPAVAARIQQRLQLAHDLEVRVRAASLNGPAAGSVAAAEIAAQPEVESAYIHARALLVCALDHIGALRILFVDARTLPSYAHMTLLRAALEAGLHARWATAGTSADRLAAGIALDWANLDERLKFEVSVGAGAAATSRLAQLMALATQLRLTKLDKKGDVGLVTRPASYIGLLGSLPPVDPNDPRPDWTWLYRFLSGYTHAKPWALTIGVQNVQGATASVAVGQAQAVDAHVLGVLERVVALIETAVVELEALFV